MARTDIHRPSAIQTDDYEFVGCDVIKIEGLGDVYAQQAEREAIQRHMARTSGKFSGHAHGGNCNVCGNANAIYTMLFWHEPTNVYIRVGQNCADKMDCGPEAFRRMSVLRDGFQAARQAKAGRAKAQLTLADANLGLAWTVYLDQENGSREARTVRDIVGKLVQYGSLSPAQMSFLARLVDQIARKPEIDAQRAIETAAAAPVPVTDKRVTVRGQVLTVRRNDFGTKILVHADTGFKLWGSLPGSLADVHSGSTVEFHAAVKPSPDDPKFGFFTRPTKAKLLAAAAS